MNLNLKSYKGALKFLCILMLAVLVISLINGYSYIFSISIVAISIIIYFFLAQDDLFNPAAVYSLFWLTGVGISNLRLSFDQKNWSLYVWINIILAYVMFMAGYYYTKQKIKINNVFNIKKYKFSNERLYIAIVILTVLCIVAFSIEVAVLKFVPIFSSEMDAYKRFHISGIHYFVVTVGIIPSLTMVYKKNMGTKSIWHINIIASLIPILIVSRQLVLLAVILIVVTYNYLFKKVSFKIVSIISVIAIVAFSIASNLRHQDISYIYRVSNMKTTSLSYLTQPYLYIAMSFENLRNIIEDFHSYKFGMNMLFPIFAFTNTKGFFDYSYKVDYLTNRNFTVSTYLSDIYFDFGIYGVIVITFLLGALHSYVYKFVIRKQHNMVTIHSLLSYCLIFSFFTTWYFNATIWFYTIVLLSINLFCNTSEDSKINNIIVKIESYLKGRILK